jgi:formyl-CoA transferase
MKSDSPGPASNPAVGPLAGLKVIELGQLIAGPFAAKTLSDFGADVIKIESPGAGDPLRKWRLLKDGTSVWWQVQSRNKRSVVLDLKNPEAQALVRQLALDADVLIENFRPGAMEGWGLGPDELLKLNPRLIMLRISGYGQTGPYRDRPGFGVVAEAMGGLRHLTAEPGRVPVRVGVSIGDTLAALHGVIGILMALHHRNSSGAGQVIDVALYEAVFNCMESLLPEYDAFGAVREPAGSALPGIAPTNAYRCKPDDRVNEAASMVASPADRPPLGGTAPSGGSAAHEAREGGGATSKPGPRDRLCQTAGAAAPPGGSEPHEVGSVGAYVLVAGNGDSIYRRLMQAIGRDDLGNDPALSDNAGRVLRVTEIDDAIGQWTAQRTVTEVLAVLDAASVPAGRIYTIADIAADPHYKARGMLAETQMNDGSSLSLPGIVPKMSVTPGGHRRNAPALGQDTDSVLKELGLSPQQIQGLRDRGIVAGATA